MTRIDELQVLKTLDPATTPPGPHSPSAQALLERIVADRSTPLPARRRTVPRIAAAAGLVAAATVAVLVLTSGGDSAFASWTATPTGLSAGARADAANSCRKHQKSGSPEYRGQLSTASTAVAERRGAWTLVVLADRKGFSALCITDDSRHLFRSYFGSVGSAPKLPAGRELIATSLGTGSIGSHSLSVAVGLAGPEVTAITYQSATRGTVSATVDAGQFALWIPGDELQNRSRAGVPVRATYKDGSTATLVLHL